MFFPVKEICSSLCWVGLSEEVLTEPFFSPQSCFFFLICHCRSSPEPHLLLCLHEMAGESYFHEPNLWSNLSFRVGPVAFLLLHTPQGLHYWAFLSIHPA